MSLPSEGDLVAVSVDTDPKTKPSIVVSEMSAQSSEHDGEVSHDECSNGGGCQMHNDTSCWVSSSAMSHWGIITRDIPERCDLSGLSREPIKYQLASTGLEKEALTTQQRDMTVPHDVAAALEEMVTKQGMPANAPILFAVHQMLRGFGNGTHTVTASLSLEAHQTSAKIDNGTWRISPMILNHGDLTRRTVEQGIQEMAGLVKLDKPIDLVQTNVGELVRSELLDLIVVEGSFLTDAPLPDFPLILYIDQGQMPWILTMRYATELFDTMVIDSFLSALCTLLGATAHPERTLGDIELLPASQVEQMDAWNNTDGSYPTEKRLHHLFEEVAERSPDKVALVFGEQRVTYHDLNELANLMAHQIRSIGVAHEQLVGLFLDKSEKMIATILGIWKSGAAHVPIDPAYPSDRVRFVLDDTRTQVIIASQRHVQRLQSEILEGRDIKIISLEPLLDALLEQGQNLRERTQNPSSLSLTSKQLAYVTYTSGTTGFPKGIYKEHTSVVNSITDLSLRYGVAQGDDEVILLFSAYVFEPFVRQMLMALTTGHRLAIINDEDKYDPDTLLPFIQAHNVTYLNGTASVIQEYDFTTCPSLKRIILVGENLTDARYKALRKRFKARIFNEYGFTESAFVTALNIFEADSARTNMSLGRPVRNVKCYILDPSLKRVPLGVTGELHIGGLGISRGYMNRDELTRQKFLPNPFQTDEERGRGVNGLMYKTGDLARWLPTGEVEYLGRADFQIKLRGIRIEPGEIEATLGMYPGVRTSIVVSKKLLNQGKESIQEALVGYFVCDEKALSEYDILSFLETKLPRYMIPARLIQLQQIPVTINGKADLRALPAVEISIQPIASKDALPAQLRDETDVALGKVWADVLGVPFEHIDLEKSFFRLGGHSITCIQLIARVRHTFGKGITIEEVFQTKTLRAMSDLIQAKGDDDQDSAKPYHSSNDSGHGTYIANSLQQGFVYHSLKTQQSDAYIMQSCLSYKARLDADLYKAAWESVYLRHPGLRLRFCWKDEVSQVVEQGVNLDWRVLDWSQAQDEEARRLLLERRQGEDRAEAYRLDQGPLSRLYFIALPLDHSLCLFSCHHSILDGWSLPLLFEYVHEAYLALVSGLALPLCHDPAYVQSQQYLQGHRDDHLEFWADQIGRIEERCDMNALLNEASRYKVPLGDYDQIQEQRQQTIELPWDGTMTSLKDECYSQGVTLHSVLQLVWHLVLRAYGGGTHTITGTTISGRNLPVEGIERALGLFINTLPLVIDHELCSNKTVLEAIFHVQDQVNAMNSRGNVELGRVQKDDLKHGLFDTLFVLENYPNLDTSKRLSHQECLQYEIKGGTEKLSYPLAVIAQERDNETCSFTLCYAGELFTDETVHDLLHTVRDTFRTVAQNLGTTIRDIEYISTLQIEQLDKWNATAAEFPNCTLHSLFESEAQQKPDKLAVVYEESRLTYHELNSRANALSYYLTTKVPIKPNQLVALVMDKSEHMITSILSVWKTGGAYVPIDPSYPDDRISYILEDTAAVAIIGDEKYLDRLRGLGKESVPLVPSNLALKLPRSLVHPQSLSTPQDLAYVMYTSGTTGRPKGVMVEHHGVVNLAASLGQIFRLRDTDDEVILSFSNYVFDHFVEQMTDALLNGQTLLVLNDEMRGDKERLYRYIAENRVTYLSGTPSVISMYEFSQFHDHLRRIDCVGEAFSEPVFDKIRETFPGLVINGYGPTEVSITTHKRLYPYPERRTDKSIGKQVANSTSYVLNSDMKRVPIGAVGELFLGGDGVVRGYHNRPDLTEDRFPINPFQSEQEKREGRNGRLYKTGDLVRWIQAADGEVEYLGRNDFQVKIRGQRIELGEIEAILSSFPEITQSVVLAKERASDGQKYLVGYYVSPVSPTPQAIRRFMQTRLPATLVPARLMCIDKFPVTVSGKLDSRALPVPDETVDEDIIAPRSEVERILAGIWAELLEIPVQSISIYSDFFSLGGDSLKSTRLSFAATQRLGRAVSVSSLFRHPTIESLAHWIVRGTTDLQQIHPLCGNDLQEIPVSPAQERLLYLYELEGCSDVYNIPFHFALPRSTCVSSFEKAVRAAVTRHEALRTLLVRSRKTSQYCQQLLDDEKAQRLLSFDVLEMKSRATMESHMISFAQLPFNLGSELPFRVQVYNTHGEGHTNLFVSFNFHHTACDAWSWDILRRDIQAAYQSIACDGGALNHSAPRVQYKEYAVEHRKILSSDHHQALIDFWSDKLADIEPLFLPTDRARPAQFNCKGHDVDFMIHEETAEDLRTLAKSEGTSLYSIMLTAFVFLLKVYSNQKDVAIGIPVAHRNHPDFESVAGFFVNLLPLRVQVSQSNIGRLAKVVQQEIVDLQIHQDMPFQEITKMLHVDQDPSRHPLVQTVFNWEQERLNRSEKGDHIMMQSYNLSCAAPSVAKFDLNATVKEGPEGLRINFNYATSLYSQETIEGLLDTYKNLVSQMARNGPGSDFIVQPLDSYFAIAREAPLKASSDVKPLSQLFEEQAELQADGIAVTNGHTSITFSDLNSRANRLARWMISSQHIRAEDRVALIFDKGIDMIVSIIAIWKTGAAYVPLDPSYPSQRIKFILEESCAKLLLTTSLHRTKVEDLPNMSVTTMDSPDTINALKQEEGDDLHLPMSPTGLAYIIFTSGTTGKPKGVLVEHQSVAKLRIALIQKHFSQNIERHSVLFMSNYVFDFSVEQFCLSFLSGNKLVIPPEEGLTHESFYHVAATERVSYISGTPSVLQQVDLSRMPYLRMVTAAGEELHYSQYQNIRERFKGPINNAYGITETTVYNLITTFAEDAPFNKYLSEELPGSTVYVLNDELQRIPLNAVGELYLGGDCVARGYLNQEGLTQERFVLSPFVEGERLYRTGDLVRLRASGQLEYLGRQDQQVKLRGFRIELSEISNVLSSIPGVKESAVIPRYDGSSPSSRAVSSLAGYYVVQEGVICTPKDIRDSLSATLPPFMVPAQIHCLEQSLPTTVNGKLDVARLAAMKDHQQSESYRSPRSLLEVKLCELWAALLGLNHCGIDDDLFALGGDSISSLQLVGDIYRQLGRKVTVKDLFLNRTVRSLHDNILAQDESHALLPPLRAEQGVVRGEAPLLPIQDWFMSKPLRNPGFWNHCFTIHTPNLAISQLREALELLQDRHDVLRMRLQVEGSRLVQAFDANAAPVELVDLDVSQVGSKRDLTQRLLSVQSRFNLESGPLMAVVYLHGFEDRSARIFFALHHMIVDTVSWKIIASDLQALYRRENLGLKSSSVQQWARAVTKQIMSSAEKSYWDNIRDSAVRTAQFLPLPAIDSMEQSEDRLTEDQTESLYQKCCKRLSASMHEILLLAVGTAMQATIVGRRPTVVTVEGHGREESVDPSLDTSRTVGWFTSMYPFEIPVVGDLKKGIVDVKANVRRLPSNGVGYGSAYGYKDGSLPAVSVNYLGQLDQTQPRSGEWALSVGDNDYPNGLVTHPEDSGKSSSVVDITFASVDGRLRMQMGSRWDEETTRRLRQRIMGTLVETIRLTSDSTLQAPVTNETKPEFTPYFEFKGEHCLGPPLFLLPPGEGGAESYFHNIVQGLVNRHMVVFNNHYRDINSIHTIEELAEFYLFHIRSIQPEGPYHILGWSFGGILTLEIAHCLAKDGQRIGSISLIDPYFDIPAASRAIGHADDQVLDPIYSVYRPERAKFLPVAEITDRLLLFKATKTHGDQGNAVQQKLYKWYAEQSVMNNLDTYLPQDVVEVVPMEGTHFTWVHDLEQVRLICAMLDECLK